VSQQAASPDALQAQFEQAQGVKRKYEAELLGKSNVVGVGVGLCMRAGTATDQVGIVVFVRSKVPLSQLSAQDRIPGELESVPVDVQEIGSLRALR
jgi:hypothetical protein